MENRPKWIASRAIVSIIQIHDQLKSLVHSCTHLNCLKTLLSLRVKTRSEELHSSLIAGCHKFQSLQRNCLLLYFAFKWKWNLVCVYIDLDIREIVSIVKKKLINRLCLFTLLCNIFKIFCHLQELNKHLCNSGQVRGTMLVTLTTHLEISYVEWFKKLWKKI